jgi:dienelactone hydrolase
MNPVPVRTNNSVRVLFIIVLMFVFDVCLGSARAASRLPVTVKTPGGSILVECFANTKNTLLPIVLILSGSKGFGSPAYDEIGKTFLGSGLQPCLVHFLSPADLTAIDSAGSSEARERYYAKRQSEWIASVKAVISYFNARADHVGKVGMLGISLGAEMALAVSANSTDLGALVIVDGNFPDGYSQKVTSLPPLYLIWGSEDHTFPLTMGRGLQEMARHLGGHVKLDVYQGGSHGFFVQQESLLAEAAHLSAARYLASQLH